MTSGAAAVAAALAAAYAIGSLSPAWLLVRLGRGADIRSLGSGNAGATNVGRVLGRRAALAVFALDAAKGAIAVAVAATLLGAAVPFREGTATGHAAALWVAGTLAVVGHIWPVYLRFRGGKGAATAAGTLAALSPWTLAGVLAVFALVTARTRIVAFGSVAAAVAAVPVHALLSRADLVGGGAARLIPLAATCLAVVWAHRQNLRERR